MHSADARKKQHNAQRNGNGRIPGAEDGQREEGPDRSDRGEDSRRFAVASREGGPFKPISPVHYNVQFDLDVPADLFKTRLFRVCWLVFIWAKNHIYIPLTLPICVLNPKFKSNIIVNLRLLIKN